MTGRWRSAKPQSTYRLFALTNGNANIDRVGIGRYFEGAVSSADVGASKPDLKMFHAVLNRAGVAANRAVHIGDHLSDDILGANNAGMLSIWYNHNGAFTNDSASAPSGEVHKLSELPESIESYPKLHPRVNQSIGRGGGLTAAKLSTR